MITKTALANLVDRLVVMPASSSEEFGVTGKAVRNMLGQAIERYSKTQDHAQRAVDMLLADRRFRPGEADIRQACMDTPVSLEESFADKPKCALCDGNRFVTVWRLVTYHGNSMKIKHSEKLDCPRGYEDAMLFAKKIAANPGTERQAVLSAAASCSCSAMGA